MIVEFMIFRVNFVNQALPRGFFSESSTSKGIPKHLSIMVSTANELRADVSQYHLSSDSKLGKVDGVIYKFIGFSFSLLSIHTHNSHIHSSMYFFRSQGTFLCIYLVYYITVLTLFHLHHYSYITTLF